MSLTKLAQEIYIYKSNSNHDQSFRPGLILVSAGFDGTADHPATLGGYQISPSCFGVLTSYLMQLTRGKVIMDPYIRGGGGSI